eukprot:540566-Amphidinium_carterae.1
MGYCQCCFKGLQQCADQHARKRAARVLGWYDLVSHVHLLLVTMCFSSLPFLLKGRVRGKGFNEDKVGRVEPFCKIVNRHVVASLMAGLVPLQGA